MGRSKNRKSAEKAKSSPVATREERPDPYEKLAEKRSAFSELSVEARKRAAEAVAKQNAVPVGERRSDKRNASRMCDGRGSEHWATHPKAGARMANGAHPEVSRKAERRNRRQREKEATKENWENGRELSESPEQNGGDGGEYSFIRHMQQLANGTGSARKRSRSEFNGGLDVEELNGNGETGNRRRKLASGRVVETVETLEEEESETPYIVEEPDEDNGEEGHRREMVQRVKRRRVARRSDFSNIDFAALEEMMNKDDPYDEEEDEDFEEDDMEEEDEDEDEEEMEDEEVTDEEVESDEIDEDELIVRPGDVERIVRLGESGVESESGEDEDEEEVSDDDALIEVDSDDDDDEDEEESESGEDEEDGDEDLSSESTHVSDDSYESAFIDGNMEKKATELVRCSPSKSRPSSLDFSRFPFNEDDSSVSSARALEWLLSPCDNQTFFAEFFQSNAMIIRRHDRDYYGNLFSSQQMMNILRENHLEFGVNVNVALYKDEVRTTHNGTGRAYPLAITDRISAGCSVQLTNPQVFSQSIWYMCDILQEAFHCFVGANTYITPAGSSGFAPHWDEIDAFLLQVEGRKYWKVYAPEKPEDELPLESSGNFTDAQFANRPTAFEGWLEQGDLLYIPRGFVHQAKTDPSVHSLHVTISCGRQWSFANLLKETLPAAIDNFTAQRPKVRHQLPPGLLDMTGVANLSDGYPLEEACETKLDAVLDRHLSHFRRSFMSIKEAAVDVMAREFLKTALPPVLTDEEKQLSAWGNADADLFSERGATRIGKKSEVRFIRRHGQRLFFQSEENAFCTHRMANSRSYEGREEQSFPIDEEEVEVFTELQCAYPDWTKVKSIKMKKKDKIAFLRKLFDNGLIMVRTA